MLARAFGHSGVDAIPIGLVHNEILEVAAASQAKVSLPFSVSPEAASALQAEAFRLLEVIQQPTRRGNHHMGLLAQRNSLLHHIQATQDQSTSERDQGPEGLERLRDLGRQFSRRGQHQGEEGLGLVEEGLEDRERKGGRFTATSLCDSDNVAVLQGEGDRLLLDSGRFLVAKLVAGVAKGIDDTLGKQCQWAYQSAMETYCSPSLQTTSAPSRHSHSQALSRCRGWPTLPLPKQAEVMPPWVVVWAGIFAWTLTSGAEPKSCLRPRSRGRPFSVLSTLCCGCVGLGL